MTLPVVEAEDRDGVGADRGFVAVAKQAASRRPNAQRSEVVSAHHFGLCCFRVIVPGHTKCRWRLGNEAAENCVARSQIAVTGIGELVPAAGTASAFGVHVSAN